MIPQPSEFFRTPIYRSVSEYPTDVSRTPSHDRRPKRVPLLVDNVWEYLRPIEMPSRRSCAFGSPSIKLARERGPAEGIVCSVLASEPFIMGQIAACPDASMHPDVKIILSLLAGSQLATSDVHALSSELLSREIVAQLLDASPKTRDGLASRVRLWSTCKIISLDDTSNCDLIGEFFFEAPLGYILERVSL
jgi:hypothetical protein